MLEPIADDLWTAWTHFPFFGIHLGTRMTVVRLADHALLLHSPIPCTPELIAEVNALGTVKHIVCPNLFHHVYAGQAAKAWPHATLHGPAKLHRKRRDLHFHATLTEAQPHPDWQGHLELLTLGGCMLEETFFYHPKTKTLISSDLIENFTTHHHAPTRWYLKIAGVHGRAGWSRLLRWVYLNRKQARVDLNRLLSWDFDRIILAHGDPIHTNAKAVLRQGMAWLLK